MRAHRLVALTWPGGRLCRPLRRAFWGSPPEARLRGAGRAGPGRAPPLSPSRPQALTGHFQQLHEVLKELEAASRRLRRLEALRRDFELQKVCYLPLNAFLLKPLQRLRHYRLLLRRLCAPGPGDPGLHSQDRRAAWCLTVLGLGWWLQRPGHPAWTQTVCLGGHLWHPRARQSSEL